VKILLVLNSIRISGSEKLMFALSKALSRIGYEFWIYPVITPFDDDFRRSIESDGYKLNVLVPDVMLRNDNLFWRLNGLAMRLLNRTFRSWYMNRFVARKCKEIGIDLMVSNSYTTDVLTMRVHNQTGIPFVIVEHGAYSSFLVMNRSFDPTPIEKSLEVVAVSQWSQQLLQTRFPAKKMRMIYNSLVPGTRIGDQTFNLPAGPFTFCMHGRDTEQKGWEMAIESFLKLRASGFSARLVLLSAGSYIDSLRARYSDQKDIVFAGLIYNIGEAISSMDAGLVLSKHYEAFGMSILDYFDAGKPVIAGNVGGIGEVMQVGDLCGGILVEADNGLPRESEVVDAMRKLLENKELYAARATDAKIIAQRFDMKNCTAAYDKLFKSLIGK